MPDKVKDAQIGSARIDADATEDGKLIVIKIKLEQRLRSFEQLSLILSVFLAKAGFKLIEKHRDTPIQ